MHCRQHAESTGEDRELLVCGTVIGLNLSEIPDLVASDPLEP